VISTERRVLENVHKLKKLEKEFLKFMHETSTPQTDEELKAFFVEAMRRAEEAFTTKNDILEDFKDVTELRVQDSQALQLLDSIRKGDKFYSIDFHEKVVDMLNARTEKSSDQTTTSLHDILFDKRHDLDLNFYSRFDVLGYYYSKIVIGPIISSSKVPPHILSYFEELKETYAFGQYRASVALCRALLEMALYRKLKARGAFKDKDPKVTNVDVAREDNLNRYINMAKWEKVLSKDGHDMAHGIRKTANDVLHTKDAERPLDQKVVVDTILSTIRILEELYR